MTPEIKFKCNGAEKFDFSNGEWKSVEECSPATNITGRMVRDAQGSVFPYGSAIPLARITHLFFPTEP